MNAPDTLRAGDSATWSESIAAYPASAGWSLNYRLLWTTGEPFDFQAVTDGDGFTVSLTSEQTAGFREGAATLVSFLAKTGQRVTLDRKPVQVLPDLTVATSFDGRSNARRALDELNAALAQIRANDQALIEEYTIEDKKVKFKSVDEVLTLINHYTRIVARENAALAVLNGQPLPTPGRVYYRAGGG